MIYLPALQKKQDWSLQQQPSEISNQVDQNLANIGAEYIFGNIVIYLLFLMMVYMLVRSIFYSVSAVMLVMYIFSVANSFVRLFRGSPIVPGDFLAMGTAKNMFMNYHYSVTGPMLLEIRWHFFKDRFRISSISHGMARIRLHRF